MKITSGYTAIISLVFVFLAHGNPVPSIVSISPNSGPTVGGTTISLIGSNFGTTGTVSVGGVSASVVPGGWRDNAVQFTLPSGQGANVPVVVSVSGQSSQSVNFSYSPPSIASISPSSGPTLGGTTISLIGSNLGTTGTVSVGGVSASVVPGGWSDSRITFISPSSSIANLNVTVYVSGQQSNPIGYSYVPSVPVIASTPTATPITYGQTLAASALSGGSAQGHAGVLVQGFFAFTTPAVVPGGGTSLQSVTFTPTDTANYTSAVVRVSVTVNQATSSIAITGPAIFAFTGKPVGPSTVQITGSSGANTWNYSSTDGVSYPLNQSPPTAPGSYLARVSVAPDTNYLGATSALFPFTILVNGDSSADVPLLPPWSFFPLTLSLFGLAAYKLNAGQDSGKSL